MIVYSQKRALLCGQTLNQQHREVTVKRNTAINFGGCSEDILWSARQTHYLFTLFTDIEKKKECQARTNSDKRCDGESKWGTFNAF